MLRVLVLEAWAAVISVVINWLPRDCALVPTPGFWTPAASKEHNFLGSLQNMRYAATSVPERLATGEEGEGERGRSLGPRGRMSLGTKSCLVTHPAAGQVLPC